MKRIILLICFIVLSVSVAKSQDFSFERIGPESRTIPYIHDSVQTVLIQAIVTNNTANTYNFRFLRTSNNIPSSWETQMCYDLCYAPFIDTIAPYPLPPYVMQPNQVDTMFYIDFLGMDEGIGTSVVRMYKTDSPSEFVDQTFTVQIGDGVGIQPISSNVDSYSLSQNYPNPFNPNTIISFSIPQRNNVSLKVYDVLGNEVANLINGDILSPGLYNFDFNAANYNLSSGVFYYRLSTPEFTQIKKMILIK